MKIIAVMGSSKNGNTTEIVNYFEKQLKAEEDVAFEYLYLNDYKLDFCVGCHNCIFFGEDKCPHYAHVKPLEDRLLSADGVVLASPGYMFSVTGRMKNFLDHVAYNCHRPKYFGRKAYLLSACTKWQEDSVFKPMETWAQGAGFTVAGKTYVEMLPLPLTEKVLQKSKTKIKKAAAAFYSQLTKKRELKPDFGSIVIFHIFRMLGKLAPHVMQADFSYFKQKKAYEKKAKWYVPAKVSYLRHRLACFMERKIQKAVKKMCDFQKLKNHRGGYKNKLI